MQRLFRHAILGGTFDHLHVGHEHLLKAAIEQAERVTIGVTLESLYQHKADAKNIEPYALRLDALQSFLNHYHGADKTEIIPIDDIYGTALSDKTIDALFVTADTYPNAELVNKKRGELGLKPLSLQLVSQLKSDDGGIISSERIRKGEVNRRGESYQTFFSQRALYHLPDQLRSSLQQPIGEVLPQSSLLKGRWEKKNVLITVGDIVSLSLQDADYLPAIQVVDLQTRREFLPKIQVEKYFSKPSFKLANNPGTITSEFAAMFLTSLTTFTQNNKASLIVVTGEEDLLTIPAVMLSPLNSHVLYGQYGLGMIDVLVTEEKKESMKQLLASF